MYTARTAFSLSKGTSVIVSEGILAILSSYLSLDDIPRRQLSGGAWLLGIRILAVAVEGRGIGIGGMDWWRGIALGQE